MCIGVIYDQTANHKELQCRDYARGTPLSHLPANLHILQRLQFHPVQRQLLTHQGHPQNTPTGKPTITERNSDINAHIRSGLWFLEEVGVVVVVCV